jgi:hypothetical protein
MNKRRVLALAAALLGGLVLVLSADESSVVGRLATGALAQGSEPVVDWWVVAGGGGESGEASKVVVNSTLGQPIIGPSSDSVSLGAGYWYGAEGPTAVTLSAFTAAWSGDDVVVAWETAMEIDTVGFNVWRSETHDSGYVRVNTTLIPSASPGSVWGSAYSYADSGVTPGTTYYYKLEELEVGGARNWYGPVSTDNGNPTSVILFRAIAGRTGFAALVWWLAGAAVVVGAGLVVARLTRRRR